jgi:hypothetical protein
MLPLPEISYANYDAYDVSDDSLDLGGAHRKTHNFPEANGVLFEAICQMDGVAQL